MDELFADMIKKGKIKIEKVCKYKGDKDLLNMMNLLENSLLIGQVEPNFNDAPFPLNFVIGKSHTVIGIDDRSN